MFGGDPIEPAYRTKCEREIELSDLTLDLRGSLYGYAPVQCDGQLGLHRFYFRARWGSWTFTLCTYADIDAAALSGDDSQPGFFHDGENEGYLLVGDYGVTPQASFMPYSEALRLIRWCASRFWTATAQ